MEKRRLFIGFLPHSILSDDLENRFKEFGSVSDVLIKQKFNDDGSLFKTFAYMNIETNPPLFQKCLSKYHNAKWKGHRLQVEEALEDNPAAGRFSRETGTTISTKINASENERDSVAASTDWSSEKRKQSKSSTRSNKTCREIENKNVSIEKRPEALQKKSEKRPKVKGLINSPNGCITNKGKPPKDIEAVSQETKNRTTVKETGNTSTECSKLEKPKRKRLHSKNESVGGDNEASDINIPSNRRGSDSRHIESNMSSKRSQTQHKFRSSVEDCSVGNTIPQFKQTTGRGCKKISVDIFSACDGVVYDNNKRKLNNDDKERKDKKKVGKSKEDMDKKRLQTLKEKEQLAKKMKGTINASLKNVDAKPSNTRIVFDSDSDTGDADGKLSSESISKKKRKDLFEADLEPDSDDDNVDRFRIRKQFEGAAGHKRFYLQTKVDDERFKMSEQFLDELEEENDNKEQKGSSNENKDLQEEKQKYLEILQGIVRGKPQAPRKDVTKLKVASFTRFDPDREEHSKAFEVKPSENESENTGKNCEVKMKGKKAKQRDETVKTDEKQEEAETKNLSDEKFYEISTDLKTIFNQGKEFSLTSAFGQSANIDEESSGAGSDAEDVGGDTGCEVRRQVPNFGNLADDEDPEDSDDDHGPSHKTSAIETKSQRPLFGPVSSKTFFFFTGDQRFSEGASFMASEDERKKVEAEWAPERKRLSKIFKERGKRAARRNKKLQEQNKRRHSGMRRKKRNILRQ